MQRMQDIIITRIKGGRMKGRFNKNRWGTWKIKNKALLIIHEKKQPLMRRQGGKGNARHSNE